MSYPEMSSISALRVPVALRAFQIVPDSSKWFQLRFARSRAEVVEPKKRLGKAEAFVVFRYVYVGYYPRKFIK